MTSTNIHQYRRWIQGWKNHKAQDKMDKRMVSEKTNCRWKNRNSMTRIVFCKKPSHSQKIKQNHKEVQQNRR